MKLSHTTFILLVSVAMPLTAHAQGGEGAPSNRGDRRTVVSVLGLQRGLTSGGHEIRALGLVVSRDIGPWIALSADVSVGHSEDHDPISLLVVDSRWHDRTQGEVGVGAVFSPVRARAFGLHHRLGLSTGPSLRWRDEQHLVGGFTEVVNGETLAWRVEQVRSITSQWAARGADHVVLAVEHDGSPSPNYPDLPPGWNEPGTIYGLILASRGLDVGWSGGLAYGATRGRLDVGVAAEYTRYRGQGRIVGSHAKDLSVRVGYRF